MKRRCLIISFLAVATFGLLNGCRHRTVYIEHTVVETPPTKEIVVTEPPPPPRSEEPLPPPGPEQTWVPGYWAWMGAMFGHPEN